MMDDLDICRRIAKIEGIQSQIEQADTTHAYIYSEDLNSEYDPLTDDALCFQLMIKYRMQLSRLPNLDYICKKQGVFVNINSTTKGIDSPNKAICLAIIELNKGKQ